MLMDRVPHTSAATLRTKHRAILPTIHRAILPTIHRAILRTPHRNAVRTLGRTLLPAALLIAVTGCGGLRLPSRPQEQQGDWSTFGSGPGRNAVAYEELIPPLAPAWTADYSAGAGRGSPVVTDSTVFVGTLRGELFAFRMRDGYRLGKAGLGNAIDGSPAIVQGSAIVALSASARSLVRFDLVDGTVIWETQCGDVETTPLVTGDRVFVGNTAGTFTCVSVHTGEIQWQFPLPGNDRVKGIRSAPSAFGNLIVFGADDGVVYALDSGSGKVVWTHRAGDVVLAPPVVVDTTIVIGTLGGTVTALAGRTGVPFWSRTLPGGIAGPVTVDPRRVVAATLRGVITALDRTTGLPLWTVTPGTPMNSGGVIVGSYYYTGTLTKELLAVRVADGEIVWRTTLEGRVKSGPAVARGRLLLATDAQTLIAFGPQMKRP